MSYVTRPSRIHLGAVLFLGFAACGGGGGPTTPTPNPEPTPPAPTLPAVPAKGAAQSVDIGSWNLEWFGHTGQGPADEAKQLANVRTVIAGSDLDVWAVQEVVDVAHFNSLVSQLSGYAGFLANDPFVTQGATYYSDFGGTEQKVGLIYKTSIFTRQSAKVILTENDNDFAGRPPLEIKGAVTLNGRTENVVIIVLHAKAGASMSDWERRSRAGAALKTYLDTTYPTGKVFIIGDFNDDVDVSIVPGQASPYASFVADSDDYRFTTSTLSAAGVSSTVGFSDVVDHHLVTNELSAVHVAGSAEVLRVDQNIASYSTTTSDHYPVMTRYNH